MGGLKFPIHQSSSNNAGLVFKDPMDPLHLFRERWAFLKPRGAPARFLHFQTRQNKQNKACTRLTLHQSLLDSWSSWEVISFPPYEIWTKIRSAHNVVLSEIQLLRICFISQAARGVFLSLFTLPRCPQTCGPGRVVIGFTSSICPGIVAPVCDVGPVLPSFIRDSFVFVLTPEHLLLLSGPVFVLHTSNGSNDAKLTLLRSRVTQRKLEVLLSAPSAARERSCTTKRPTSMTRTHVKVGWSFLCLQSQVCTNHWTNAEMLPGNTRF